MMMTTRRTVVLAVLAGLLALGTTACTTKSCSNDVCSISMSGESSTDFDESRYRTGRKHTTRGPRLAVERIEPGAVTVSVDGERARLAPGQQARLDVLLVKVVSISGKDVKLETRPA
ncbi:hypothetical protein WEH80_07625 [Actinomycetes bacterium KLBMP 9759]